MKLISFNCTIEVNKDKDGYSNHVYIDVNKDNVHLTQPYTNLDAETAAFITKLEHDFINHSIDFNRRIDGFNRDNHLEQYAPRAIKTEETTSEALLPLSDNTVSCSEEECVSTISSVEMITFLESVLCISE